MRRREVRVAREALERLMDRLRDIPSDDREAEVRAETQRASSSRPEEVGPGPEADREVECLSEQLAASVSNLLPRWDGSESELDLNHPAPILIGDAETRSRVLRWQAEIEADLRTQRGEAESERTDGQSFPQRPAG